MVGSVLIFMAALGAEDMPNLVVNAGFEAAGEPGLPAEWRGAAEIYQRDATVAHSGSASLKYENADPSRYLLFTQSVSLEQGKIYEISAWVKTEGVVGDEGGATICLEWADASGKWLGGHYPAGVKGTANWTEVRSTTPRIPKEAASFSLSCYLRQGITGTAWWDDVSLRQMHEQPLHTVLRVPNYRGEVTDAGPKKAIAGASLVLTDYNAGFEDLKILWKVLSLPAEKEVAKGKIGKIQTDYVEISAPARRLAPGAYRLEIALVEKASGEILGACSHPITREAGVPKRKVSIDGHNRVIVDGTPFFPLGMYWGSVSREELDIYAESAFNCLMPYSNTSAEQLDWCHSRGLKVIYSIKDYFHGTRYCPKDIQTEADEQAAVLRAYNAVHDHPALLAWYINDELGPELMPRLEARQAMMQKLDPEHPTWVVLYQVDRIGEYLNTFDVIGTDPYPIPDRPASMAANWTRKTVTAVQGCRPVWQVPQAHNWANYRTSDEEKQKCRPPTLEEMRSMAWQCIAEGANGLIFYSWFDLRREQMRPFDERWAEMKIVAQEIADTIPVLLSIETPPAIAVSDAPWLNWTLRQKDETAYLITVNNSTEKQRLECVLPSFPKSIMARYARGRNLSLSKNTLSAVMPPLVAEVFEIKGLKK